jgi:hypothetical protein
MTVIDIARLFRFVREVPQNEGLRVNAIQRWSDGQPGDNWCAEYVTMMLDLAFQGNAPIPRQGSCEVIYQQAKTNNWIVDTPVPGDLVLSINSAGVAHHVGIITTTTPLTSIAGNTSPLGNSDNGTGVFEHPISATPPEAFAFVHYPPPTL